MEVNSRDQSNDFCASIGEIIVGKKDCILIETKGTMPANEKIRGN